MCVFYFTPGENDVLKMQSLSLVPQCWWHSSRYTRTHVVLKSWDAILKTLVGSTLDLCHVAQLSALELKVLKTCRPLSPVSDGPQGIQRVAPQSVRAGLGLVPATPQEQP